MSLGPVGRSTEATQVGSVDELAVSLKAPRPSLQARNKNEHLQEKTDHLRQENEALRRIIDEKYDTITTLKASIRG